MRLTIVLCCSLLATPALAGETKLVLDGPVPDGGLDHFFVPFDVPEGTVEIEVQHDDLSDDNILDWGLDDPAGFRGWGGGNTEPAVIGVDRASRSYVPGPITPGTWRVVVGKAKIVAEPAMYQLRVTLRTAAQATLAAQPERAPYADPGALATGRRFDLVMITAVWMHLDPQERRVAMPIVASLLHTRGVLTMSLRHGPVPAGRRMFEVGAAEAVALAGRHGLQEKVCQRVASVQPANRAAGVSWTQLAFMKEA